MKHMGIKVWALVIGVIAYLFGTGDMAKGELRRGKETTPISKQPTVLTKPQTPAEPTTNFKKTTVPTKPQGPAKPTTNIKKPTLPTKPQVPVSQGNKIRQNPDIKIKPRAPVKPQIQTKQNPGISKKSQLPLKSAPKVKRQAVPMKMQLPSELGARKPMVPMQSKERQSLFSSPGTALPLFTSPIAPRIFAPPEVERLVVSYGTGRVGQEMTKSNFSAREPWNFMPDGSFRQEDKLGGVMIIKSSGEVTVFNSAQEQIEQTTIPAAAQFHRVMKQAEDLRLEQDR